VGIHRHGADNVGRRAGGVRAASLVVIPARPGFFDIAAVRETVAIAKQGKKPYAVVINAAPVKRDEKEAPAVAH
jgi:chromosome partitioning protein